MLVQYAPRQGWVALEESVECLGNRFTGQLDFRLPVGVFSQAGWDANVDHGVASCSESGVGVGREGGGRWLVVGGDGSLV